jgi:small subunit ribosomal protein S1
MANPETPQNNAHQEFELLIDDYLDRETNLDGQVTKGTITKIDRDAVIVDVNLKSEGRIPLKEFSNNALNVGDVIDVYIVQYEGPMGDVRLSHERAHQEALWQKLNDSLQNKTPISGTITAQVKGGMSVHIDGITAFLPGSQVDVRPTKDLSKFVDVTADFVVLKVDRRRHNIVVSRRVLLEQNSLANKEKILSSIELNQRMKGVVKNITTYGAFVDLGGIDGLLHISDISWKTIDEITDDVLKPDQEIDVIVLRVNKESQRISLGMKQLEKDPWTDIHAQIKEGDVIDGIVCNVQEYGVFVRLESGLEGLAHRNSLVWCNRQPNPKQLFEVGQSVQAKVLEILEDKRRISLGVKECTENPLVAFAENHPEGSVVSLTVKEMTDFGLIVSLNKDIEVTVPKMHLPGNRDDIMNRYEPGKVIQAAIKTIMPEKELIFFDFDQEKSGWTQNLGNIAKNDIVQAKVSGISEKGITVIVGNNIQSDIFISNLSNDKEHQDPRRFHVGQEVSAKVMAIDSAQKKITLSIRAAEEDRDRAEVAKYNQRNKADEKTAMEIAFEKAGSVES